MFDRKDNVEIFSPFLNALKTALQSKPNHPDYQDTLSNFQMSLLHSIMACNGVSMREFQAASLKLWASKGLPRNVYIDGSQCYLGKPEAKQHYSPKKYYEAYWLLEDKVGLSILLYGGIFRPLEVTLLLRNSSLQERLDPATKSPSLLMEEQSDSSTESPASSTAMQSPYLFIKSSPQENQETESWKGRDINQALLAKNSPLQAEARVYRHFTKALLKRYLSQSAIQLFQAFHGHAEPNRLPTIREEKRDLVRQRKQQLALSQAVHELLGLKPSPNLQDDCVRYLDRALQLARHLVQVQYSLAGNNWLQIQAKVHSLSSSLPFLYGEETTSPGDTLQMMGDDVLVQVTATVLHGPTQPSLMDAMPLNGYSIAPVAVALSTVSSHIYAVYSAKAKIYFRGQIWTAVQEWSSGSYNGTAFSAESFQAVIRSFKEILVAIHSESLSAWLHFCLKVHQCSTENMPFVDEHPPPHILPLTALLPFDSRSIQDSTYAEVPVLKRQPLNYAQYDLLQSFTTN
ncbi:hypothetical protein BDQ12DRAFT_240948 [Crucibulum laeve]|uniref:Uncharacterized protein n=1 Tax=Crucibulum laeve TaxID=68775 RepID=A0A5C3LH34_9AGAR|nr:hypothetical protein BDQ12DRAFT_240948 [Crucibulum laeve]